MHNQRFRIETGLQVIQSLASIHWGILMGRSKFDFHLDEAPLPWITARPKRAATDDRRHCLPQVCVRRISPVGNHFKYNLHCLDWVQSCDYIAPLMLKSLYNPRTLLPQSDYGEDGAKRGWWRRWRVLHHKLNISFISKSFGVTPDPKSSLAFIAFLSYFTTCSFVFS